MKLSFRAKTVIGIAAIEAVLLAVLVIASLNWLKDSNEAQLTRYAQSLANLFAISNQEAVLSTDLAKLDSFVKAGVEQADIAYVRVEDNHQRVLAQAGQTDGHVYLVANPLEAPDGIYHSFAEISIGDQTYGRVELGIDVAEYQSLLGDARSFVVSVALLEIALVAVFSLLLGTYLVRRLGILSEAAKVITHIGPGIQIPIKGNDEVSEMGKAFNKMSAALEKSHQQFNQAIEEQQALAKDLDKHRQLLNATITASMDGIITIDRHGYVLEYSQSAERIFGYRRDEIMGKELVSFIVPEQFRDAHSNGMKHFRNTGEAPVLGQRLELPALHKHGYEFLSELTISSVEVGDETIFTAYIRNISERKQQEQERLLAAHAFDANEAIFVTDAEAKILRVNKAFTRITGYSEDEAIGQTPTLLASGVHTQQFYSEMWQRLSSEGRWSGEIINRRKNGDYLPELLSISSVANEENEVTHYVAHFTDLSEQKAVERSLEQAKTEAELASQAKSRFLASMSHEIRTPLNAIINMNQILQETELDPQQRQFLSTANEAGHTLMALVNNVLDFSRIEAGELEFNDEWFALPTTLRSIVELFESTASQKMLTLALEIDKEVLGEYYGEPLRFRQVVFNLLGNAIKFTEKGGIKIVLNKSDTGLTLSIKDSGIGIPQQEISHLFEEFYQVEAGSHTHPGTGLGLAITYQLVERMGGNIEVKSELEQGTEFIVSLPLEGREAQEQAMPVEGISPRMPEILPSILLVEDSKMNQTVVTQVLKDYCQSIECADNGKIAVEMSAAKRYDIIFMDMAMPVMDGLEATRKIRRNQGPNQHTPIIAMTANAFVEDKQACFDAGMDDFLSKPIAIPQLRETLTNWLQSPALGAGKELKDLDKSNKPVLEKAVLEQMLEDVGAEALQHMLALLDEEVKQRAQRISELEEQQDWETLAIEAHAIKGNIATFGGRQLQQLSFDIEIAAKQGQYQQINQLIPQLEQSVVETTEQIKMTADQLLQGSQHD